MNSFQPKSIVVLTGAGISAESGIKTFRDHNGLWENHRIEEVATPQAFMANPKFVHRFYNLRREQLLGDVLPNQGHIALAKFEKRFTGQFTLITQNVDDLHERAGSTNVRHMHGELLKARCTQCEAVHQWEKDLDAKDSCPSCLEPNSLRPHIVWFGEMPFFMDEIQDALSCCDMFIAIGTSGHVYPAAGFVQLASDYGAHTVELNLEPSAVKSFFATQHYGLASQCVPDFLAKIVE